MFMWTQLTHLMLVIGAFSGSARNKWFGNGGAQIFIEGQVNLYVFVMIYLFWPIRYKFMDKYETQAIQNDQIELEQISARLPSPSGGMEERAIEFEL